MGSVMFTFLSTDFAHCLYESAFKEDSLLTINK